MQSSPCYDAQLEDKLWGRFQRPLHGLENHTHVEIIVIPFNVGAQDPITKLFAEVTSTANPEKEFWSNWKPMAMYYFSFLLVQLTYRQAPIMAKG